MRHVPAAIFNYPDIIGLLFLFSPNELSNNLSSNFILPNNNLLQNNLAFRGGPFTWERISFRRF